MQEEEGGLNVFPTSEHYMMAMKARIFRDEETAEKITKASTPAQAKSLGREVKNFNQQVRALSSKYLPAICDHLTDSHRCYRCADMGCSLRFSRGTGQLAQVWSKWSLGRDLAFYW